MHQPSVIQPIHDFDPKKVKMVQYGIWIINKAAGDFKGFGKLEDEIFEDFYILMLRYQQGSNWDMIQRIFMEILLSLGPNLGFMLKHIKQYLRPHKFQ